MPGVTIEKPKTPEDLLPIHVKRFDPTIPVEPSFKDAAGVSKRALVDADQHAQVDVLSSVLPSGAATEATLATLLKDAKIPSALQQDADGAIYGVLKTDLVGLLKQGQYVLSRLRGYSPGAAAWQDLYTDDANRLKTQLDSIPNPPNLDVLLSTRASTDDVLPVKDVTTHLSAYTLAAGGTVTVDIGPITNRTGIMILLRVTYNAAATAGVRIRWLYSHDGVSFDTPEDADAEGNYFEPSFTAGATRQRSTVIAFVSPYVRLSLVNLDPTYAVTVDHLTTVEVK